MVKNKIKKYSDEYYKVEDFLFGNPYCLYEDVKKKFPNLNKELYSEINNSAHEFRRLETLKISYWSSFKKKARAVSEGACRDNYNKTELFSSRNFSIFDIYKLSKCSVVRYGFNKYKELDWNSGKNCSINSILNIFTILRFLLLKIKNAKIFFCSKIVKVETKYGTKEEEMTPDAYISGYYKKYINDKGSDYF